ncbi:MULTISPECIES: hypothetical protein [unclassified Cryobacterium]|uniref:hypothetical protein n=1 Tax=unclassified Cryobacterium TaxID=2649013 RepID=UPI000CE3AED0|nr:MULTISPECIES: hypothetical protein [unclassified Cryobacterium]
MGDCIREQSRIHSPTGEGRNGCPVRYATLAAADLTAARVAEAHLDARAILTQAGQGAQSGHTWGVFAAGTAAQAAQ